MILIYVVKRPANVKNKYLKCIASRCLSPRCMLFFSHCFFLCVDLSWASEPRKMFHDPVRKGCGSAIFLL